MTPELAKSKSNRLLAQYGVLTNDALPCIEEIGALKPQMPELVARRAIILTYIIGIAFDQPGSKLLQPLQEYGLANSLSAREDQMLKLESYPKQDKIDAGWLDESIQSLAWTLGLAELDPFKNSDDDLPTIIPEPFSDPTDFIDSARLRPFDEIYQQADLYYRLHWVARDQKRNKTSPPLSNGVMRERRRALDWVLGVRADWDTMELDT